MITEFISWLKGLSGGEATFYGALFAGCLGGIGALMGKLAKRNTPATSNTEPEKNRNDKPVKPLEIISENGLIVVGVIDKSFIQIINVNGIQLTIEQALELETQYLNRVMHDCGGLEWLALVQQQDEQTIKIGLDSIYTALLTTTFEEADRSEVVSHQEKRAYSAVALLNKEPRLVITGAPGSGKSAFVNFVALCLAGEMLNHETCHLRALTRPLPGDDGKPQGKPQPWEHGALLPLRIILRDFAASEHFPGVGKMGDSAHLMSFIRSELKSKSHTDFFPILEERLRRGEVLLMLDGLDEVPQSGQSRERMIQCIQSFHGSHQDTRLLVTARPYAYEQKKWKIRSFKDTSLADFAPAQIGLFVERWYANRPEFDPDVAEQRATKLKNAVIKIEALHELARRPLLLTLMAFLHSNRHELPERRADLYERLLELLIEKWEKARFQVDDVGAANKREQYSLAEFLQVGVDSTRKVWNVSLSMLMPASRTGWEQLILPARI